MKIRQSLALLLVCSALMLTQGCLLFWVGPRPDVTTPAPPPEPPPPPPSVEYQDGALRAVEPVTFRRAWDATQAALQELDYQDPEWSQDNGSGSYAAEGSDKQKVSVRLRSRGRQMTELQIRLSPDGGERRARQILDRIREEF